MLLFLFYLTTAGLLLTTLSISINGNIIEMYSQYQRCPLYYHLDPESFNNTSGTLSQREALKLKIGKKATIRFSLWPESTENVTLILSKSKKIMPFQCM